MDEIDRKDKAQQNLAMAQGGERNGRKEYAGREGFIPSFNFRACVHMLVETFI